MNDRSGSRTRAARGSVVASPARRSLVVVGADGVADGSGVARVDGEPVTDPAAPDAGLSTGSAEQAASSSATTAPADPVLPTGPE